MTFSLNVPRSHGVYLGFFFVVQNSQLRSIRAMYTGDLSMSAVRRPSLQRAYIREVSKQTTILRLQGISEFFCFFFSCLLIKFHQASSFSEQSHLSRKLSEISSKDHLGNTALFSSLCSICRLSLGSICRLLKRSCGYTGFLPRRGLHWSFVASQRTRPLGKRCGAWRFLVCGGVELFGTFNDAMECEFLLRLAIGKMTNIFW
jgi:SulP family sulfate permease